jgi:hypothetical protein
MILNQLSDKRERTSFEMAPEDNTIYEKPVESKPKTTRSITDIDNEVMVLCLFMVRGDNCVERLTDLLIERRELLAE